MANYNTGTWRIYCITNTNDGKVYIGQTVKRVERRWHEHVKLAFQDAQFHLHRAIRSSGVDAFEVKVLIDNIATFEEACQHEVRLIAELEAFGPEGYNMTIGGDGIVGKAVSIETRQKMSKAAKRRAPPSAENLAKRSASMKGRPKSAETRKKMSAGSMGKNKGRVPPNKGVPATKEQIEANRNHQRKVQGDPFVKAWNRLAQLAVFARKRIEKGAMFESDAALVAEVAELREQRTAKLALAIDDPERMQFINYIIANGKK